MKKILHILIIFICMVLLGTKAFAQTTAPLPFLPDNNNSDISDQISGTESNIGQTEIVNGIHVPIFNLQTSGMRWVIRALFFIAGPVLFIMIVWSGIMLVLKADNEEELTVARKTLIYSLIGLVIIALAYTLVENIIKVFTE